jgi:hypothetical protein
MSKFPISRVCPQRGGKEYTLRKPSVRPAIAILTCHRLIASEWRSSCLTAKRTNVPRYPQFRCRLVFFVPWANLWKESRGAGRR